MIYLLLYAVMAVLVSVVATAEFLKTDDAANDFTNGLCGILAGLIWPATFLVMLGDQLVEGVIRAGKKYNETMGGESGRHK